MPLHSPGEFITEGHQKYSEVHNDFIPNRKRLRCQLEFPILFGNVNGLSELFAARRSDPAYIIFDVKRDGAEKKVRKKSCDLKFAFGQKL